MPVNWLLLYLNVACRLCNWYAVFFSMNMQSHGQVCLLRYITADPYP